ncbi:MAG: hypothetical protein H7A23_19435 [Leptospiraceae bacterium]|nr:hypothetical protein [Leptospiraceae bacterium]MCP5496728.1 hypothetical protein [Leptospiraceae bacterium]
MEIDEEQQTTYEERKTPAGYLVKVRLNKMTYVVFTPKGPEIPKGAKNNSIIVTVPRVVFLGDDFNLSHFRLGELSFVNVKSGKLVIPYQHGGSRDIKTIFLNSGSESDVLPVVIYHYEDVKEIIGAVEQGGLEFHHIVADENLKRTDMVTLKIRYPSLNILILKKKISTVIESKAHRNDDDYNARPIIDTEKARAAELVSSNSNLNMYSENPVFLARIHMRKMELDKVKQLLFDFNLKSEDVIFIRTFLSVMIKDEAQKNSSSIELEKLKSLDEVFRLAIMIIDQDEEQFEKELEKGFSKEVASMVYALLEKYQEQAVNIEDEIMLWEWKYRARRLI